MKHWRLFLLILILFSCQNNHKSSKHINLDFERSDLILQKVYKEKVGGTLNDTLNVYKTYFEKDSILWSEWIFGVPYSSVSDIILARTIIAFAKDKYTYDLIDSVKKMYPENYDFPGKLAPAIANLLHHFPKLDTPKIRTFVLGYNYNAPAHVDFDGQVFYNKKYIGLGLHYMLGTYFSFYHPGIPYYIRRRTEPKFLLPNVFHKISLKLHKRLTAMDFPTLLDEMINAGIRYYVMEKVIGELVPMKDVFYYTKQQWEWTTKNEAVIYKTLLPLLYEKNYIKYRDFIGEGPFSKTFGKQAPARLGEYIGWKIVKNYMENNPHITLQELVRTQKKDYIKIFRQAKYKPV